MLAVRWLEANAGISEQETAVPTPEQLRNVKMNRNLDLFRTTCKILSIPKAIERIWSRQRLMNARSVICLGKRKPSILLARYGPRAYKRAFLTHKKAVTTAVKRVAGAPCVTETENRETERSYELTYNGIRACVFTTAFSGTGSKR